MVDVVIVGAGIAGMTAALYLRRANKNVLIIEKNMPGGAINMASTVKNYPGITTISGPDFSMMMYDQLKNNGIDIIFDTVKDIEMTEDGKVVKLSNRNILTKFVLLATGKDNRKLNVPMEKELMGHGVSYCALCDGTLFKNCHVCVIGTGDAALEEALYLSSLCKKVTILAKYDHFKCQEKHLNDVLETKNIKIIYEGITKEFKANDGILTSLVYEKKGITKELKVDGAFIYIGSTPNIFASLGLELENNYVKVNDLMETSVRGIYACGDVVKKSLYQLVTASSDGAIAATSIIKELNRQ